MVRVWPEAGPVNLIKPPVIDEIICVATDEIVLSMIDPYIKNSMVELIGGDSEKVTEPPAKDHELWF